MFGSLKKLFNNVYFYSVFTKILGALFGFLYSIIVARYLGAEMKGQLSYINSFTGISVIIFSLGVHQAYPFYKKRETENIKRTYVHTCLILFCIYMLVAVVLLLIPGLISDFRLKVAILLTPILVFSKLITYLIMVNDPNRKHRWETISKAGQVVFLFFFAIFTDGSLIVCIAAIVLYNLSLCIYFLWSAREKLGVNKNDFKMLGKFISFGILPMFTLLMNDLNYRADILMLGNMTSDVQVGIYSIGVTLAEEIWLLSDALRDVLYSRLASGRDVDETNKVIRISLTACAIAAVGLAALGKPFIVFVYGQEYAASYTPMLIVLLGTLVMVYYKVIQAYNVVHHKQRVNFVILCVCVAVNIVLNLFLIPVLGINGAAIASLISYSLCAILFVSEYIRSTGTKVKNILFVNKSDMSMLVRLVRPSKKR